LARTIPGVFGEQLFYGCQAKESPYAKCEMRNVELNWVQSVSLQRGDLSNSRPA